MPSIAELLTLGRFVIPKLNAWRNKRSKQHEVELATLLQEHALYHFRSHCRELANELIRRDPDRFFALAEQISTEISEVQHLPESKILAHIDVLYRDPAQFNLFRSMNCHTTYRDCFLGMDSLTIEKYFRDIQIWCALQHVMADVYVRHARLEWKCQVEVSEAAYGFLYYKDTLPELEDYLYVLRIRQESDAGLNDEDDEEIFEEEEFLADDMFETDDTITGSLNR